MHLDKAPDAFRTISEVAGDLDIPQHVLRFWETRFVQIKPMKRSGGRRYYRPEDVDLLKGIRRLLYGEGYTIRGVQRILKEQGIKSVQALSDGSAASFGAIEGEVGRLIGGQDFGAASGIDADDEEQETEIVEEAEEAISEPRPKPRRDRDIASLWAGLDNEPAIPGIENEGRREVDAEKLKGVLADLIACRQLLDGALKDG